MTDHRPIPVAAPAPYLEHPGDPTTDFRGWITKFDCYLQLLDSTRVPASGLTDKQKNALLFMHLGVEGERIFSTHPRAASRDTLSYNDYSTAVKEQFQPRVTHLKASFDFHRRLQLPGESVDAFVCALRSLIADCDYADPSQHLLEQLVAGCHDKDLQRDLLAMPNPAFDRCLEKMRASEMATKEASDMAHRPLHKVQGGPRPTSTPASNRRSRPPNPRPQSPPSQRPQSRTSTPNLCIGCGRKKDHPRAACPAFDKECSNCHRLGHFAAACRQKGASKPSTSRTVTEGDADIKILNSATPISTTVDVSAGSRFQPIQFEVDTGASPTIMPWSTFRRNFPQTRLQTSGLHLKNYDGSIIQGNRGWFLARIVHGSVAHQDRIYVLQDPAHAVLGKNFLQPLQMVIHCNQRIVQTVQQKPAGYLKDFPVLTATNLGTFPGYQHRIQLSSDTQYLPGPQNQTADALSRLHEKAAALDVDGITLTQLQLTEDPTHTKIKEALRTGWPRQSLLPQGLRIWHQHRHQLRLQGDILMWDKRIVPPEPARTQILQQAHRGHPGIVRMKRLLRQTYWWPGMQHQVESFVKFCHPCQRSEKSRPALPMPTTTIPRARTPAKQWALDITGPFWNGRYLVVALDAATNFPEVLDTTTTTSTRIIQWLKELFARYGNPDAVLTDNGRQFTSQEFQTFLKHLDIHHYTSSVYNPQENGQVERFNKYLKYGIQTFGTSTSWEEGILGLLKAYRLTPAKDNGDSPAASFLGHEVRGDEKPNMEPPVRRTLKPQPDLKQRTQITHHVKKALYKIGDRVLSKLPHVPKGQSPYSRPKTITEVVGYYTFRLDDGQVWNARKLRPFRTRPTQTSTLPDTSTGQPGRHLPQAPPTLRTSTRTTKGAVPQRYGQWVVHRLRGDHAVYGGNTQYRKFLE